MCLYLFDSRDLKGEDKIPDGYKVSSDEEALQIVRSVAETLSLEDMPVEKGIEYAETKGN